MNKRLFAYKRAIAICVVSASFVMAKGQNVGEYGFLDIPVSPRAVALGGSAISVVEPEAALADQNPALLCPEMAREVSLSYINYVSDINLGYASFTGNFLSEGAWMGSVRYVDYGDFAGYDANGNPTGSFSAKDIAFGASVGYPINDRWNLGGTVRGIYTHYESYSAFALGVDVGVNYYNENSGRSYSLVVSNLGGQLKSLDDRYQHLPTQVSAGMTKEVEHLPICVTVAARDLLDWDYSFIKHFALGAEWIISDSLYFAAGYNFRHLSAGGGFKYRNWNFQAAYARYNRIDGSLNIGISYNL